MKKIAWLSLVIGIMLLIFSSSFVNAEINPTNFDCLGEKPKLDKVESFGFGGLENAAKVKALERDSIKWEKPKQNLGSLLRDIGKWLEDEDKPAEAKAFEEFLDQFFEDIECKQKKESLLEYQIYGNEFDEYIEEGDNNLAKVVIEGDTYVFIKKGFAERFVNSEKTSKFPNAENYDTCTGQVKIRSKPFQDLAGDKIKELAGEGLTDSLNNIKKHFEKNSDEEKRSKEKNEEEYIYSDIKLGNLDYPNKKDLETKRVSCKTFEECEENLDKAEELGCKYNLKASVDFGKGVGKPVCENSYDLKIGGEIGNLILLGKSQIIEKAKEEKGVDLTIKNTGGGVEMSAKFGDVKIPMWDCVIHKKCEDFGQSNIGNAKENICMKYSNVPKEDRDYIHRGYKCPEDKVCVAYQARNV